MFGMLLRAWRYRHFIFSSIKNEFLSRFARSRLGALWMVIHPLAQVAIFAFILSAVLSSKLPGIDNRYAEEIALYNSKGEVAEYVNVGEAIELGIKVKVHRPVETLVLGYGIKDRLGQVMYGTNTWHTGQVIHNLRPGDEYRFVIAFPANLGIGSYSIQTALVDRDTHLTANYEWRDMALVFNVVNIDKAHFAGCLWNEPHIKIESLTQ